MAEAEEPEEEEQELFEHYRIKADKGQEPMRIDKFLIGPHSEYLAHQAPRCRSKWQYSREFFGCKAKL